MRLYLGLVIFGWVCFWLGAHQGETVGFKKAVRLDMTTIWTLVMLNGGEVRIARDFLKTLEDGCTLDSIYDASTDEQVFTARRPCGNEG